MNYKTGVTGIIFPTIGTLFAIIISGCSSVYNSYTVQLHSEFQKQPLHADSILTEDDIRHMPVLVQRYLRHTGWIGKNKVQNFKIEFDAVMRKNNSSAPMDAYSEQYNFISEPGRFFFMKATMTGIPARVLHVYRDHHATMRVQAAFMFNVVNLQGEELSKGETVTILNDICFFAPAALIDRRMAWKERDSTSVEVTFTNGPYSVSAILFFNNEGELIDFSTLDRPALQDDGSLRNVRWSTPIRNYADIQGRKIPTYGETVYHYPDGDLVYGKFTLKNIIYNISAPDGSGN